MDENISKTNRGEYVTDAEKEGKIEFYGRSGGKKITFIQRVRDCFLEKGSLCLDLKGLGSCGREWVKAFWAEGQQEVKPGKGDLKDPHGLLC